MLEDTRLSFVGSGVMAEAILQGLLHEKLISTDQVCCADPFPGRLSALKEKYGVSTTADNAEAVKGADVVVLSTKPQVIKEVMESVRDAFDDSKLVISIIAGVKSDTLRRGLGHDAIVRVMPNTPARVSEGMSVWTCSPAVTEGQREQARCILQALGEELMVSKESDMDMATALSGTGPAYVFLFMEALIDAGVHMGFSRRVAEKLVLQTVKGSVDFALESGAHLAELRNQVTSPGGTTADALYHLEKGGLRTVVSRAVFAAFKKSQYLSHLEE